MSESHKNLFWANFKKNLNIISLSGIDGLKLIVVQSDHQLPISSAGCQLEKPVQASKTHLNRKVFSLNFFLFILSHGETMTITFFYFEEQGGALATSDSSLRQVDLP